MFAITIDSGELNKTMVTSVSSQSITKSSTTGAMATSSGFARLFPNSLLNSFQKPPETRPVMGGGNDLSMYHANVRIMFASNPVRSR